MLQANCHTEILQSKNTCPVAHQNSFCKSDLSLQNSAPQSRVLHPQLMSCVDRMSLAGLWLLHLRAYPLLCLPGLFCSSFVYSPFGVGERAKHCFLLGFVPGLDMGEEGMLQITNVLPASQNYSPCFPFPQPSLAKPLGGAWSWCRLRSGMRGKSG